MGGYGGYGGVGCLLRPDCFSINSFLPPSRLDTPTSQKDHRTMVPMGNPPLLAPLGGVINYSMTSDLRQL